MYVFVYMYIYICVCVCEYIYKATACPLSSRKLCFLVAGKYEQEQKMTPMKKRDNTVSNFVKKNFLYLQSPL